MPSGGITITPGYQLGPSEKINNAKLNQLGQPVGRVDEGAIGSRELDQSTNDAISIATGRNLFCNGDFVLADYFTLTPGPLTGVISGGFADHDYGSANRWLTANEANRTASIQFFALDQTDVPDFPHQFLRWAQSAAVAANPSYFGQRLEDVRRFSGRTITLSIWVRATATLTVTPKVRQFFGNVLGGASAPVITAGTAVPLAIDTWTNIVSTLAVPSVAGKVISASSFTEFRIDVPQGISFQIDFAHAQVEMGGKANKFDPRSIHEDIVFALRYYEILGMRLSTNLTTWTPFVNTRMPLYQSPILTLLPTSGTGATLATIGVDCIFQNVAHGAPNIAAQIIANAEIYAT